MREIEIAVPPSSHDHLKEIAWMIGDWVDENDDTRVETSCQWTSNGNFMTRSFKLITNGASELEGTQVIGWDSKRKQIRCVIRGNLIDELTGTPKPIQGSVDKESQRVAISLVDNASIVAEMGLYDLTEDTLTMMIHRGKDDVQTRGLVRLTPPDQDGPSADQ